MILNRAAKDYDVATGARPEEVVKLFARTRKIGAKFGVVMVLDRNQQVEVATFRTESGYADGRHPDKVEFATAKADAARRDFTINGMFYDPVEKKILDFVGGQADLARGVIRTIGKPHERFGEDYLRMLRAVRFSTRLGFGIEDDTWAAIGKFAKNITKISGERIAMELEATLADTNRRCGALMLVESGLAGVIFAGMHGGDAQFGIEVVGYLRKNVDFPLALAGLFAAFETDDVVKSVGVLKLSGAHRKHLKFLLESRGRLLDADMALAQLKLVVGEPYFWDLYDLQWAIQRASSATIAPLVAVRNRARQLKGSHLRPKPLLDGRELIGLGVRPGPMVGLASREMYIAQLGEQITTADQARLWVADWLKKHRNLQ
jgi:poly(A) polymerase